MVKRLSEFIKKQGISVRAFEQKICASDGMIRRAIGNNTDIQCRWIANIADNYPELNIEWLLTGNGEMFKNPTEKSIDATSDVFFYEKVIEKKDKKIEELNREIGELNAENKRLQAALRAAQKKQSNNLENTYKNVVD